MRRTALAAAVLTALAAGSAGAAAATQQPRPLKGLQFLHVGPPAGPRQLPQILDESGRQVILRGVNVNGLVDYWRSDLQPPYPIDPAAYDDGACPADSDVTTAVPFCEADVQQIAAVGFDVIRLPVSWSLLEPQPGRISVTPIDRIAQVVRWAGKYGIRVVIDLHQDAWSKYLFAPPGSTCPPGVPPIDGGDGAPQWASQAVSPVCAAGGIREADLAVQEAAQRFWLDLPAPDGVGLQEHYADVVTALAQRFHDDPTVAGYELMNEPQPGLAPVVMDETELMTFHAKVVDQVVAQVPGLRQLFFVEPGATRNVTAARTYVAPWSAYSAYPDVVYAPHIYTGVFTADTTVLQGQAGQLQSSDSDYAAAIDDAKALGLPLWVGEFGNDPRDDRRLLDPHYAHQDAAAIGGALWVWKEHGAWGAFAPPYDGGGVPRTDRVTRISTAYPIATAGVIDSFTSDPFRGTATLTAHSSAVSDREHATVVALPDVFGSHLTVTGAAYDVVHRRGIRQVLLYPTGGTYSLRVS